MEVWTGMRKVEKTKMRVSVVIPLKDEPIRLERCIKSIVEQTFRDHEILVIDGCPSGPAEQIVDRFKGRDDRVRYIPEEFFSMSGLMNRAIMESDADIILITDVDCDLPPDWIAGMVGPFREGANIVQGGVDISSKRIWSRMHQRSMKRFFKRHSEGMFIDHVDTRNLAVMRDALIDVGMFDRHVRCLENLDIKLKMKGYGFRIWYLGNVKATLNVDQNLHDLFWEKFDEGRWRYLIYSMYRGTIAKDDEMMFGALRMKDLLLFPPSLILMLMTKGPLNFISELMNGTALRFGIIAGLFSKRRFMRSIRTRY